MLAFGLGVGVLFLSLYQGYATEATNLLFGSVVAVSRSQLAGLALVSLLVMAGIAACYRPLLFSSVDPEVAEARGVPLRALSVITYLLLALTTAEAVQVVGVLLIFALIVTPAAIAVRFTSRPSIAILTGIVLALFFTWLGLAIAYYSPHPVSFFITSLAFFTYVGVRMSEPLRSRLGRRSAIAQAAG